MHYGWVVLCIVTLLEGLSGFGRTIALSPLLQDLCNDLSLSMTQISSGYALSHLCAVFALPFIGKLYDKIPTSRFLLFFVLLFSCSFILLSQIANLSLSPLGSVGMILLGYIGIRLSVHSYSIAGRATIAVWFSRQRGIAVGCYALFTMLIGSMVPSIIYELRQRYHWSYIWLAIGLLWFLMGSICFLVRSHNHITDSQGRTSSKSKIATLRPFLFIFVMITLFFKAFQNSGIMLHLFPMCTDFGADKKLISLCFMPIYIISSICTFIFGHILKQNNAKGALFLFIVADLGMLIALKGIAHTSAIIAFVLFTSIYWSMNNIVATLVLPILFGVKKIGALHGWAYAFVSLGSAVGSLYFGLMKDYCSYQFGLSLCIGFSLMLLTVLLCLKPSNFVPSTPSNLS